MLYYEPNVALELAKRRAEEMRADAERYRLFRRSRLGRRAKARGDGTRSHGGRM